MNLLLTAPATSYARALADVVDSVPYSSASQFYEYFGDEPVPAAFGVSCAWQSFSVGQRLAAAGGPTPSYLVDGRHVAAVAHTEGSLVVLDPYLMHREPLVLRLDPAAPQRGAVATVPALPIRTATDGTVMPSRVRAVWRPHAHQLRLEYTRFSPATGRYVLSRFFTLDTDRELVVIPPPAEVIRPLLLHPEQNNVSIRVVDGSDGQVRELVYPLTGANRGRLPGPDGLIVRDNQGTVARAGEPRFDRVLADLAAVLNYQRAEVVDFVLGAARIHGRVASPDLLLPDYHLVNE